MNAAKRLVRSALLSAPGSMAGSVLARDTVTIVMLHRFTDDNDRSRGAHTRAELRALLQGLRKHREPIVSLGALAQAHVIPPPPRAIAFTVDDGYADFANIAWPVFREFDCPVTVFLMTGFLDRQLWPWWERVRWAFDHTRAVSIRLRLADEFIEQPLDGELARRRAASELIERLKRESDEMREAALTTLPAALEVDVPVDCPAAHAPMSWDEVRSAGREGATFGPHTVTHPILSTVDDVRAEKEVADSWNRVRSETDAAIPIFCYPNGDRDSFGTREETLVARHGFAFALSAMPGNATQEDFSLSGPRRFRIPRYSCPRDPQTLRWLASGWTRLWSRGPN